jgi:thioesterase domain-containing protein/acyl carrier protein
MSLDLNYGTAAAEAGSEVFEFPCSLAQQRFWVLDQLNPGEPCYNIAVRWRLRGKLNPVLVERAFNQMLRRHEVLCTTFRAVDGEPVQVISPNVSISVPVVDLRQVPEAQREQESDRITIEDARKCFDLTVAPLIRVKLQCLQEEEHIVAVVVHHSIADGWSIGIMAKELGDFYEATVKGRPPALAELPIQYADFAVWQQEWLKTDVLTPQIAYWKKKLGGLKPLEIQPDFDRPAIQTANGTILSRLLPRSLTDALKDFSNRHDVTLYTTALAAFKMLMWHCSGQTDIAVGTQVAGRGQVEIEDMVGCFINTLVMRTEVKGDLTFLELLNRVKDTVTEAIAHQEMPFEQLVDLLRPKRDLARNPLFGVNFIYQRAFIKNRDFAGISLIDLPSRSPGAIYDMNFFMVERVEGWRWSCEFNTDLYSPETVERMLDSFQGFLRAIVENPERRVADFQLSELSQNQRIVDQRQLRSHIEADLTKIWEELLSVRPISRTADFFEIGGHSLLATRLLARVEKKFGKQVPLATLFQAPTIQQLTTVLLGGDAVPSAPGVVALQPSGSRTPLFCLHGIPSMRNLAKELGSDQPFLSVNIPDIAELTPPYSVEQLAALHIKTIRMVQPEGPYLLIGWCREGLLAYEVAQQLRAQRERVDLIAMFDTWIPKYLSRFSTGEARRARRSFEIARVGLHAQKLHQMRRREMPGYLWEQLSQVFKDRLRHFRWRTQYRLETGVGSAVTGKQRSPDEILWLATQSYRPKAYDGRVILFRSDKYRTWKYWDRALGWSHMLSDLTVHEVPGIHDSMLTGSQLSSIARAIRSAMGKPSQELGLDKKELKVR